MPDPNAHLRVPCDFESWPADWPAYHNGPGHNVACDMAVGPCACTAWHQPGEFELRKGVLYRYGEPVARKEPTDG